MSQEKTINSLQNSINELNKKIQIIEKKQKEISEKKEENIEKIEKLAAKLDKLTLLLKEQERQKEKEEEERQLLIKQRNLLLNFVLSVPLYNQSLLFSSAFTPIKKDTSLKAYALELNFTRLLEEFNSLCKANRNYAKQLKELNKVHSVAIITKEQLCSSIIATCSKDVPLALKERVKVRTLKK
ncbi:MAG: hypothetical protein Q4G04_03130 [bacterium]|nr:hypothetical protein [bacterium]